MYLRLTNRGGVEIDRDGQNPTGPTLLLPAETSRRTVAHTIHLWNVLPKHKDLRYRHWSTRCAGFEPPFEVIQVPSRIHSSQSLRDHTRRRVPDSPLPAERTPNTMRNHQT